MSISTSFIGTSYFPSNFTTAAIFIDTAASQQRAFSRLIKNESGVIEITPKTPAFIVGEFFAPFVEKVSSIAS